MNSEKNIYDAQKSLSSIEEATRTSIEKAIPSKWFSIYWGLYSGAIISWPGHEGPYGFYIFFILTLLGLFLRRKDIRKGVRLSIFRGSSNSLILEILFISVLIGIGTVAGWAKSVFELYWIPFAAGVVGALIVFLLLELIRSKLIKAKEI